MASGRMVDYLGQGLASARPASLSLTTGAAGVYYATDTASVSFWGGSTWSPWIGSAATVVIPIGAKASDETTALTVGTAKVTYYLPFAFTLTEVIAGLVAPQTSGAIFTADINAAGASILSTKLTIDNTEETSITAATPAVISAASHPKGTKITVDVDQVGDGTAKGLEVWLIGYKS